MSNYRTGIIACGIIARVHARGWQGVKGRPTAIGAIADTNPDALREFGDFFEVGEEYRYADYRQMLDRENLDFVDVCSWHQQHAEMVIAAAARQPKAIICQKPMAIDLGEADDMLTACVRNGVKLMIAYQRPHHATWLKARELIRQGTVGQVSQIQLDAGGNLLNTNSHNIRLALFLMDEPRVEWVMGALERTTDLLERGLPAEDAMLGIAACDNGATILIQGNLIEGLGQGCRVIGSRWARRHAPPPSIWPHCTPSMTRSWPTHSSTKSALTSATPTVGVCARTGRNCSSASSTMGGPTTPNWSSIICNRSAFMPPTILSTAGSTGSGCRQLSMMR